eukprot:scaffold205322_cov18-Tisochrysis_lutea.AAC.1
MLQCIHPNAAGAGFFPFIACNTPASTSARASTQTRLCGAGAAAGALPRAAAEPAAQHGLVHPQQPPLLRCPHASKSVAASVLRSGPPAPVYPPSL